MRKVTPLHPIDESVLTDLAHGLLLPDEKREVVSHLHVCAECEQRFSVLVSERESARAALPEEIGVVAARGRMPRARKFRTRWVAAVAAAAVVAALGIARFGSNTDPTEYWIPIGDEAVVLRSDEGASQLGGVHGALEAYARKDAAGAVQELEAFAVPSGNPTAAALRDLFLASALVNADRFEAGEKALQRLAIKTMPTQWRRQARWVHYLALSGLGRDAEARELVELLAEEPGEVGRLARAERERLR